MSLNLTPPSLRCHIGFFGMRNAGKSSLVNKITNQEVSLVSNIKGTTTDPVKKSMELLPLGPVMIIDTPGYDDYGTLGEMRVRKTKEVLKICDIIVFVTDNLVLNELEEELLSIIKTRNVPYLIVHNKIDLLDNIPTNKDNEIYVSTKSMVGINEIKIALGNLYKGLSKEISFVKDFIKENDIVILVTPIDESAPKGRMILPEQQAIRDILDGNGIVIDVQVNQLQETLNNLKKEPVLVVTDSQVFSSVMKIVPESIPLTSFSILMARYKGFLDTAYKGVKVLDNLKDNSKILISEGCTHHRQCQDIGTVKLPNWLKNYTNKNLEFTFTSGHGFPEDLSCYDLIIHCGGCMLNDKEILSRMDMAIKQKVPFTNYGTIIAYMNGILERATSIIYNK